MVRMEKPFVEATGNITLEQIEYADVVRIGTSPSNAEQVRAALSELLENARLIYDQNGDCKFYPKPLEESIRTLPKQDIVEFEDRSDHQVITGFNFRIENWAQSQISNRKVDFIEISFDLNSYGYWTYPGVLVNRCLGQGLKVFVPKTISVELIATLFNEKKEYDRFGLSQYDIYRNSGYERIFYFRNRPYVIMTCSSSIGEQDLVFFLDRDLSDLVDWTTLDALNRMEEVDPE